MKEEKVFEKPKAEEFIGTFAGRYRPEKVAARPSRRKENAALLLALVLGFFFLAYPSAANYWNNLHQYRAVRDYAAQVADMSGDEYIEMIRAAQDYNRRLAASGLVWKPGGKEEEEYLSLLSVGNSGIMGYIDIPKINIKLPVYHGISERCWRLPSAICRRRAFLWVEKGATVCFPGTGGCPARGSFRTWTR